MRDESAGSGEGLTGSRLRLYLGMGASAVALLAFFGIRNFDDLRQAVGYGSGGGSGVADACNVAYEAYHSRENDDQAAPAGSSGWEDARALEYHTYAGKLRQAADLTSDGTLKAHLVNRADDAQHIGEWWGSSARSDQGRPSLMMLMDEPWKKDCVNRGIKAPS
ncbi:hypothetical protein [Kitasatospora sp. McL0602]|uniref:hypothetical protein n=1 Tax=Kitasatospora sp. McL0602 TaxID=3439530 RepID=UPI003F88B788